MITTLTPDVEGYRKFLSIKQLPRYKFTGRTAWFPDEYASRIGLKPENKRERKYNPPDWMMDYQRDIARIAVRKKKYCLFMDCGMGKTPILLDHAKHAAKETGKPFLIVSPLMVIQQTIREAEKFYGSKYQIEQIRLVRLYSNPGELVFSPFAGRRFYGCEIKPEYIAECKKNLTTATTLSQEKTLFDTEEAA